MSRTNSSKVKGLLRLGTEGGDYDDENCPDLQPYIDSAGSFVDDVIDCATEKGTTLSTSKREILERWVAAHFYCCSDQTYASKKTGEAAGVYHGRTGKNFESTRYGQAAMSLDPTGCVRTLGMALMADMSWVGKPPSAQIDYVDRD